MRVAYRKVMKGVVTDEIEYLSAINEASTLLRRRRALGSAIAFVDELIDVRHMNEFTVKPVRSDFMDVSPKQVVSVARH